MEYQISSFQKVQLKCPIQGNDEGSTVKVTNNSKVRRLNLNLRRFGLVSVMAVPHAAGWG